MGITTWSYIKVGVFHSFKGGTGKTTVALNVAKYLSDLNRRVLLIETDVEMPCFLSLVPPDTDKMPKYFWNDVMDPSSGIGLTKAILKLNDNLSIIYANTPVDASGGFTYQVFADQHFYQQSLLKLQREFARLDRFKEFDFILLDASPGISYGTVNLLILSSVVCLILRPVLHDVTGAINLFKSLYKLYLHDKKTSLVWNQVPHSNIVREQYIKHWNQQFQEIYTNHDEEKKVLSERQKSFKSFMVPYSEEIAELHARGEIFFPKESSSKQVLGKIVEFMSF